MAHLRPSLQGGWRIVVSTVSGDIPLGSIYEQDIWSIYRKRYSNTRLMEFKQLPDECISCTYRSVCTGGCRAACGTLFGEYDRKDHRCLGPYSDSFNCSSVLDKTPTFSDSSRQK